MKLFAAYLKSRKNYVLALLLFGLIYFVLFGLYRLPLEAVLYATAICLFFGILIMAFNYRAFLRRHRALLRVMEEIDITAENLPAPRGLLESEYQMVLKTLFERNREIVDQMNLRYMDMIDYYTVWVHQIKTPISSMKLALQGEPSEKNRELNEELQRIEQYVEMVLCYVRLDAGITDYVFQEYDLDGIIKQAVRKFASQFIRKRLRLAYEPLNRQVLTDEKWLLFVIEQVLSNALKYTRAGTISIALEPGDVLIIEDTGIGIATEDLARIFENGFTGYNGRGDKKASGIGLYLCKRICDNLGHSIAATAADGGGTRICIGLGRDSLEIE